MVMPPVLGHLNFSIPFVVYTGASAVGLGAVLVQKSGTMKEEVLASPSLNSAERNYSATEMECLAVVCAFKSGGTIWKAAFLCSDRPMPLFWGFSRPPNLA